MLVVVLLGGLGYVTLYLAVGDVFLPYRPLWCVSILWATSQTAGYLASKASCMEPLGNAWPPALYKRMPQLSDLCLQCQAPPLLARTLVGLLLRNINALGDQVHGNPRMCTLLQDLAAPTYFTCIWHAGCAGGSVEQGCLGMLGCRTAKGRPGYTAQGAGQALAVGHPAGRPALPQGDHHPGNGHGEALRTTSEKFFVATI